MFFQTKHSMEEIFKNSKLKKTEGYGTEKDIKEQRQEHSWTALMTRTKPEVNEKYKGMTKGFRLHV